MAAQLDHAREGADGQRETMLAGQYALAGARRGERVVYYGFEEPRPLLLRNFRQIGLAMDECVRRDDLRVICRYPEATSLEDLLVDMRIGLEGVQAFARRAGQHLVNRARLFGEGIPREHGRSAALTQTIAEGHVGPLTAPYLSTVADAILALDYSSAGFEINRTMRVIKMRGSGARHPPVSPAHRRGPVCTWNVWTPRRTRVSSRARLMGARSDYSSG